MNILCPGCERKLKTKHESAGKRVKCPSCGQIIMLPANHPTTSLPKSTVSVSGTRDTADKAEAIVTPTPQSKWSHWRLYAAGGAVFCLVVGGLLIFALPGKDDAPGKREVAVGPSPASHLEPKSKSKDHSEPKPGSSSGRPDVSKADPHKKTPPPSHSPSSIPMTEPKKVQDPPSDPRSPVPIADKKNIRGTWEGEVDGQPVSLTFRGKNDVRLTLGKKLTFAMAEGTQDGWGTYSVDWNASPARLDIDWKMQKTIRNDFGSLSPDIEKRVTIQAILQLTEDKLKVDHLFPGGDRPPAFTGKAAILKRDKAKDAKDLIHVLQFQIGTYWLSHSKAPPSLQVLIDEKLAVADDFVDPWGQPFQYDPSGKRGGGARYSVNGGVNRYIINPGDIWTVTPDMKIIGNW